MKAASLGIRVLAAVIDSLAVSVAWYYIIETWGRQGSMTGQATATMGGDKVLAGFPAMLLMLGTAAFWILPEWIVGATVGKLICGLRVRTLDGGTISLGQSAKRNTLRLVDFFPFYLTGFLTALLTPNRQRLGDLWAGTIVVSKKHPQTRVESPKVPASIGRASGTPQNEALQNAKP